MSSSPKYSDVRLSEEAARRLREERRRREEAQAARRAAEAEQRRKERLRQNQAALKTRLGEGKKELAEFGAAPASRHVADSLRQLQARLAQIEQSAPATEEAISQSEKELQRIRRELKQIVVQGKAAEDTHNLQEEAATVLRWKYQAAEDRQGSRQFDPDGLARFETALRKVEKQLAHRDLAGARRAMTTVGRLFEQHRGEVEKGQSQWLVCKQAGEAALVRVQEGIADLQADETAQRWEASAVANLTERASELRKIVEKGQCDRAKEEADKLLAEAKRVLKVAEERQCKQERDDLITNSTVAALQACGLSVEGISQSQQGTNPSISIRAVRPDGRTLAVNVQEGRIEWSADGFPMDVGTGTDGRPAAVCDEAVEQIEAIQERLSADHGIETSTLTWAGQDPNRPKKLTKKTGSRIRQASSQRTLRAQSR